MCPLRIILIFLSATLAGFFLIRNLKSQPLDLLDDDTDVANEVKAKDSSSNSPPLSSKVCGLVSTGFWTFVDMASGKYLWRNLAGSQSASSTSTKTE